MKQTKEQRQTYVSRRADELALSGKYQSWIDIEFALRAEGYPEARGWLDSHFKREWLDKLCQQGRDRLAVASQS
jgi:hypothetical protein